MPSSSFPSCESGSCGTRMTCRPDLALLCSSRVWLPSGCRGWRTASSAPLAAGGARLAASESALATELVALSGTQPMTRGEVAGWPGDEDDAD